MYEKQVTECSCFLMAFREYLVGVVVATGFKFMEQSLNRGSALQGLGLCLGPLVEDVAFGDAYIREMLSQLRLCLPHRTAGP